MLKNIMVLFVLGVTVVFGQYTNTYEYGRFVEDTEAYVFKNEALVYLTPSMDGKAINKLPIGYPVVILEELESSVTVDGYAQNWVRITFDKDGESHEGYVLEGSLSMVAVSFYPGSSENHLWFLWSILSNDEVDYLMSEAKVVQDGKMISAAKFTPIYTDFIPDMGFDYTVSGQVMEDEGFSPSAVLFVLTFVYEACGFVNGDILVTWNGSELNYAFEATSVAEAGVFHWDSELVFPGSQGGKKNQISVISTQEEFNEDIDDYELLSKQTKVYTWDGTKLIGEE